uniref:Uncharacterized protein n=1 Tax=Megaselia scalaris TaxID=36166 RepID=T1GRF7_MEGSC
MREKFAPVRNFTLRVPFAHYFFPKKVTPQDEDSLSFDNTEDVPLPSLEKVGTLPTISGKVAHTSSTNVIRSIGSYQCGFMSGRGTSDHFFTLRQILKKPRNPSRHLHLFIYNQAYNTTFTLELFKAMNQFPISSLNSAKWL